ncbi:hypothetical protein Cob_v010197 [Colletotrichum orbiculare MAFF 240422]|uniref:Rhodopsin domain-containing protein n=1 Tax=Colletotrichum orbiculare (strain 104-T / ATCC 96160 / CBS 514.97 / LARS 414 / MAFF 240422) TaxID=1213857 RepID=N4V6V9_COLOR|nr:hypothetical protein Cob_v010197 [Colletotrichum orbiculare MAFF 240422]
MTGGDAAVAEAFAAGRIPADISVKYLDEDRDTPSMVASITVYALTFVIVIGRAFSRYFLRKRFGVDDILAVTGMAMFTGFIPLCIILINIGSGRHFEYIQYVMTQDTLEDTEILDFTAHLVYTTALLFCRYSGLAFYFRVCGGVHTGFHRSIKGLGAFLFVGYLAQIFLIVFHCLPVTALWPYEWQVQFIQYKCLPWGFVYGMNSAISLLFDFVLFGIPIAMLRMLAMTRKRKIQLACILLPGTLVVAISVVRLILVINGQWQPDQSWIYSPLLAIEVAEIGATLIALSIPGIRPLVDEAYNIVTVRLSRMFPNLFKLKDKDLNSHSSYDAPPWQNHPTPRDADFKVRDMKEMLDIELEAIEKYESKRKSKLVPTRTSKIVVTETAENRI